jgi:hypothetical protein
MEQWNNGRLSGREGKKKSRKKELRAYFVFGDIGSVNLAIDS